MYIREVTVPGGSAAEVQLNRGRNKIRARAHTAGSVITALLPKIHLHFDDAQGNEYAWIEDERKEITKNVLSIPIVAGVPVPILFSDSPDYMVKLVGANLVPVVAGAGKLNLQAVSDDIQVELRPQNPDIIPADIYTVDPRPIPTQQAGWTILADGLNGQVTVEVTYRPITGDTRDFEVEGPKLTINNLSEPAQDIFVTMEIETIVGPLPERWK